MWVITRCDKILVSEIILSQDACESLYISGDETSADRVMLHGDWERQAKLTEYIPRPIRRR